MAISLPSCPETMRPHVEKVLAGEYSAPVQFPGHAAHILDLGANVGAFTLWASEQWPGAKVIAFEPHPENAKAWRENCAALASAGRAKLIEAAVTDREGEAELFDGANNCGEASIVFHRTAVSRKIKTVPASTLPACHVLKIDTEGCEPLVLANYRFTAQCPLILLEFHSEADREKIAQLLNPTHRLCELQSWLPNVGIMKWMKNSDVWRETPG